MQGHYELRREIRLGVEVIAIIWVVPGALPLLMTTVAPERVPLLAAALNEHLRRAE